MRKTAFVMSVVFSVFFLLSVVYAASLWKDGSNLYADRKAHRLGDIVTVIIDENTLFSQKVTTDSEKKVNVSGGPGKGPLFKLIPEFGVSGDNKYNGDGTNERKGELKAKIAAKIIKILPNGNYVIEGKHTIIANKEKVQIVLTGMVRADDISSDNTVHSTQLSDAEIHYVGKGPLGRMQKPGILTQIFNLLF
ncbi:MAG: flagellar basal body L-ring protein FlgH [Synergistetes bacterium]|nr:flagellar basal body L-ring protein FlgH [Synergistota bacterium]